MALAIVHIIITVFLKQIIYLSALQQNTVCICLRFLFNPTAVLSLIERNCQTHLSKFLQMEQQWTRQSAIDETQQQRKMQGRHFKETQSKQHENIEVLLSSGRGIYLHIGNGKLTTEFGCPFGD